MAERAKQGNGRNPLPRLLALGAATQPERSRLAAMATSESLLRLALSFILALALWLYITGKQAPSAAVDLQQPLSIGAADVPAGLTVTNQLPYAHIRYRTSSPTTEVTGANVRLYVELLNFKAGVHRSVPVVCQTDPGITCVSVSPRTVAVALDQKQQKQVPVTANVLAQPPAGYTARSIRIFPNTVQVTGPRTLVSQVARATVDLNLSGITAPLDGSYRPSLINTQGGAVASSARLLVSPTQLTVHVDIAALATFKPLPVIINLKGQPGSGFAVTSVVVNPPEVTVQGAPSTLRGLRSIRTQVVYLARRKSGFSRKVGLALPRGVRSSTRRVTVLTKIQPVDAYTSLNLTIRPLNVPPGLTANVTPARALVTVVGPATKVRSVARVARATVDLARYGAGTYSFRPHITLPRGFHVANVFPSALTVTVSAGT